VFDRPHSGVPRANFKLNFVLSSPPPAFVYKMGAGIFDSVNQQIYNFIFHKCDEIFNLKMFCVFKSFISFLYASNTLLR